MQQLVKL